jgi:hypothetical protein
MEFLRQLDNLAAETAASMTIAHQITHSYVWIAISTLEQKILWDDEWYV